jgi:hypothetical protein
LSWPEGRLKFGTTPKFCLPILFAIGTAMTQPPARRRILFRDVAVGQRFYDPISAEYFVKQDEILAAMVTGIGDGSVPDEFEADDVVGIDL